MAMSKIEIQVMGMTCGHCEASVVAALQALPGVVSASADRTRGVAELECDGRTTAASAASAVCAIGFDAKA